MLRFEKNTRKENNQTEWSHGNFPLDILANEVSLLMKYGYVYENSGKFFEVHNWNFVCMWWRSKFPVSQQDVALVWHQYEQVKNQVRNV